MFDYIRWRHESDVLVFESVWVPVVFVYTWSQCRV